MSTRLVIEGNAVYEIDEDCQAMKKKFEAERALQGSCACQKKDAVPPKRQKTAPKKQ